MQLGYNCFSHWTSHGNLHRQREAQADAFSAAVQRHPARRHREVSLTTRTWLPLTILTLFRPFTGEYDQFFEGGTYSCVVCHQDLFSSDTKFDSGCGWPAFFDS